MPKPIFVLNGPNINLLGEREPDVYGFSTLDDIRTDLEKSAATLGVTIDFRQSNSEGDLVDWVQEARHSASGLLLNAGAYSHTSIAILDAIRSSEIPCIEVHLSNIFGREPFRHHSYISEAAVGVICGLGAQGYDLALQAMARRVT